MEPRTSPSTARLSTIGKLSRANILTRVLVAPVIPGLTDHETPAILSTAAFRSPAGAQMELTLLP